MKSKTIVIGYGNRINSIGAVKIEFPGGIVHVETGLCNARNRKVVHVSVTADGARYEGDPEWWAKWGDTNPSGGACRIIQDTRMNVRREA